MPALRILMGGPSSSPAGGVVTAEAAMVGLSAHAPVSLVGARPGLVTIAGAARQPTADIGSVTGIYGPGYAADDLNNTRIGYGGVSASYRFRAVASAVITSVRIYIIFNGNTGYSNGTGGTLRCDVHADDGTANHFPTGPSLATASRTPGNPTTITAFPVWTFNPTTTLTAGSLYHLVWTNTGSNPTTNYGSLDGTFSFKEDHPYQPKWPTDDVVQLTRTGTGPWTYRTGSQITPTFDIAYGNGERQGNGYMETWGRGGADGYIRCDGTRRFREAFTVSGGSRVVNRVHVRLAKVSGGSGPLSVRLETSGGSEIETVTIPAASVATAPLGGAASHGDGQNWVAANFASPRTLTNGQSYNLVLHCPSGTTYWCTAVRKGFSYGFHDNTVWTDGHAQIAENGTTWANVKSLGGTASDQASLQFWFDTV